MEKQPGAEQIRDEVDRYIGYLDEDDFLTKQKLWSTFLEEREARRAS